MQQYGPRAWFLRLLRDAPLNGSALAFSPEGCGCLKDFIDLNWRLLWMLPPIKRRVKVFVARADPRGGDRFQAAGRSGGLGLDLAHIAWAGAEPALKFQAPAGAPAAMSAATKKICNRQKSSRGDQKNFVAMAAGWLIVLWPARGS